MFYKRILDVIVSSIVLILLSPIFLVVAIAVRINLGLPILFKQNRPGLNAKPFTFYKFRTMKNRKDDKGELLPDKERLTELGKFLRSTSLDELPAFWNVLRGDMSLVGPRPLLLKYLDRYTKRQKRRHEVKPGITGWAQINGRNEVSWEEKFELDIWYVENRSFWLDIKILLLTVWIVIKREGINSKTSVTMEEFKGN